MKVTLTQVLNCQHVNVKSENIKQIVSSKHVFGNKTFHQLPKISPFFYLNTAETRFLLKKNATSLNLAKSLIHSNLIVVPHFLPIL